MNVKLLSVLLPLFLSGVQSGILYPRASETRELLSLDGLWDFALTNTTNPLQGHEEQWYKLKLPTIEDLDIRTMPVPASYNDIATDPAIRDHVGLVWYQRNFFVPKSWKGEKVWVRFGSVCRAAEVWVNGQWVVSHDIGHLPFEGEISSFLEYGRENNITVAVDNTLLKTTIPQGSLKELISGRIKQTYTFDFFNYAGIDRPVFLYTTPNTYIDDITVVTDVISNVGYIYYEVSVAGSDSVTARVTVLDKDGQEVAGNTTLTNSLLIENATLWWPYLMDPNPGYMYSFQVELLDSSENLIDKYTLPVGIRTISWNSTVLSLNSKPVYLRGFGRHEDSDVRGKGLDLSTIIRDHNLIKWVGANAYRTSHYPYAEEIMDLADKLGIMIVDECPAVNTEDFSDELLANHKKSLTELIQRDKNRASVIMWSAANEPRTQYQSSEAYYKEVISHVKSLDTHRPVTVVNNQGPDSDHSGQFIDIASFNVYDAWYSESGDLDVIAPEVVATAKRWHELHNIPVLVTEYGADTQEGLHILPSFVWSEEYQNQFLSQYFKAFDQLRNEGFFVGEMIWNFADFKTAQTYTRVGGNKKGIFTRNRQPKSSAHLLRKRYWALAQNLDNSEVPDDLEEYIIKDEL